MQHLVFQNKINFLKIGIFIFPIILVIFVYVQATIFENNYFSYDTFVKEDGPAENATSILYFISAIFSVLISAIFIKIDKKLFGILYLILFVFFIVIALEEISWGQRILNLETPDLFSANLQGQIGFHNLPMLNDPANLYFPIIGVIGTFGWALYLIKSNTKYNFFVRHFIPKWYFATFFIPGIMFSIPFSLIEFNPLVPEVIQEMFRYTAGEFAEFFISLGIFLFILSVFSRLKSKVTRIKKQIIITIMFFVIIPSSVIISLYFSDPYVQARIFHGNDLSDIDLSNTNLSGIDFTGTVLVGANLANANLVGANLSGINFTGTVLVGANLANANLDGVDLLGKNLSGTNLSGVDLSGIDFTGTILVGANLANANLAGADLSGKDLTGTVLIGANLANANLDGVDLLGKNLSGTNLSGVDLSGKNLMGTNRVNFVFSGTELVGASLTLGSVDIDSGTILVDANLTNANLSGADLSGIDFTGTVLVGANLANANLEGAILDCLSHQICN